MQISDVLKKDVAYRFTTVDSCSYPIYSYCKGDDVVIIAKDNAKVLKENFLFLTDQVNNRLSSELTKFNKFHSVDIKSELWGSEVMSFMSVSKRCF